jgi:hypothetical protein
MYFPVFTAYSSLLQAFSSVKVKLSRYSPCGGQGERIYSSYSFVTSVLDGMSCQRHALAPLYSLERDPGTQWIGGWVGLGTEARGKNPLPLPEIQPRSSNMYSDTILTELPRLPRIQPTSFYKWNPCDKNWFIPHTPPLHLPPWPSSLIVTVLTIRDIGPRTLCMTPIN